MLTNSIINDIKYQFRYGNIVVKIIFANVGVFLALGIFNLICYFAQANVFYGTIVSKLEMPASLHTLLYQPWSVFTYMFMHEGFFHILFNMLWFYWFGEIFVLFLGEKKVLPVYILGGLAGALIYLLAYNIIPVFKPQADASLMLGASASIMAVVFGAVALSPDYEIRLFLFGNVRIKYVALISLLLDIINIPYGNAGGYIAHIGGAIAGYYYIKLLQSGTDIFAPFAAIGNLFKPKPKVRVTHKSEGFKSAPRQTMSDDEQKKVDGILDKISRSGYDSLTADEKEFLFNYSKK